MSQREVMIQKVPHILLSAEIEKRHGLKIKRPVYNLDVPEVDLNLSTIALCTNLTRGRRVLYRKYNYFTQNFSSNPCNFIFSPCRILHRRNYLCKPKSNYSLHSNVMHESLCLRSLNILLYNFFRHLIEL